MNYIEPKKLQRVRELAQGGDQKAKDFLFTFMEMDDKDANEYLASIATETDPKLEEPTEKQLPQVIEALIKDENEAIDGYDKAIKFVTNSNLPSLIKTAYIDKLQKIKDEEIEHIEELKEIL